MDKLFVLLAILFVAILVIGVPKAMQETEDHSNWCKSRGYVFLSSRGPNLCYDPNTRLVYRPE